MIILKKLEDFIEELALMEITPNAYNQYSYREKENSIRRKNLMLYLKEMYKQRPKLMLVAEAPGYRGCRLTGVPFTSEHLLMNSVKGSKLFGKEAGYSLVSEKDKLIKEATATIIRETLLQYEIDALAWNAFPLHPHKEGNPNSNRTPTRYELLLGEKPLIQLIEIFNINEVVAIGNKAIESLNKLNINAHKVRHPAQGGKKDFVEGICRIKEIIYE